MTVETEGRGDPQIDIQCYKIGGDTTESFTGDSILVSIKSFAKRKFKENKWFSFKTSNEQERVCFINIDKDYPDKNTITIISKSY